MTVPKVSVLMCVYNTRPFLQDAIRSILDQSMTDLELIVIDDQSSDGSWEEIQIAAAQDTRLIALRNPQNTGAAGALNRGLAQARGRYVTRQDSDDLAHPDRLAQQITFLESHPEIGAVGTAVNYLGAMNEPLGSGVFPTDDLELQGALLEQMCFCGPSVMIRCESLKQIGWYFDEGLSGSEDYDLALRLAEVTHLANLSEPLYGYRQHEASVSHARRAEQMHRSALALEKAVHRRSGLASMPEARASLARHHLRAAVLAADSGDLTRAQDWLRRALQLSPALLDSEMPVLEIVRRYSRAQAIAERELFCNHIFGALLPETPSMSRIRRRLLSESYMSEVFDGQSRREWGRVDASIVKAIRNDPRLAPQSGRSLAVDPKAAVPTLAAALCLDWV